MHSFHHVESCFSMLVVASVYGDPHITTFDGTTYTFNGRGEFWLARVHTTTNEKYDSEFIVQGRFEQPLRGTRMYLS